MPIKEWERPLDPVAPGRQPEHGPELSSGADVLPRGEYAARWQRAPAAANGDTCRKGLLGGLM